MNNDNAIALKKPALCANKVSAEQAPEETTAVRQYHQGQHYPQPSHTDLQASIKRSDNHYEKHK